MSSGELRGLESATRRAGTKLTRINRDDDRRSAVRLRAIGPNPRHLALRRDISRRSGAPRRIAVAGFRLHRQSRAIGCSASAPLLRQPDHERTPTMLLQILLHTPAWVFGLRAQHRDRVGPSRRGREDAPGAARPQRADHRQPAVRATVSGDAGVGDDPVRLRGTGTGKIAALKARGVNTGVRPLSPTPHRCIPDWSQRKSGLSPTFRCTVTPP